MKKTLLKQIIASAAVLTLIGGGAYALKENVSAFDTSPASSSTAVATKQDNDGMRHSFGLVRQFSDGLLALLKLDKATLEEKLTSGKSLAQIAQEQGVTRDALKTELTAQATQNLDQQKKDLATNIDQVIDSTDLGKMGRHGGPGGPGGHGGHGGPGGNHNGHPGGKGGMFMGPEADLSTIAKILGYADQAALKLALDAGNNLADLATEKNVNIQLVKDEVSKQIQAHLDAKLAAKEITQAQYDEMKADIADRVDHIVNHEPRADGDRSL